MRPTSSSCSRRSGVWTRSWSRSRAVSRHSWVSSSSGAPWSWNGGYAAPGQKVLNTLQTNATLIDDEWASFLAEHHFLVGVSIDGPREMHDAYRVDKGGKPTFDRVVAGLETLQRHGVEWNALTTVNAANGDHGRDVYRFLRDDLGARFIQLIPIVERVTADLLVQAESGWGSRRGERPLYQQRGDLVTRRSVGAEQYGRFLIDVFEEWGRHDVGDVFVQMFDTALAHWMGMHQTGMCVHAVTCGDAVALEHNGDLYSCDHYVEPDYLLGNITEGRTLLELVDSPRQTGLRRSEEGHAPRLLPVVRCPLRLQRWLSQGPFHHDARRRGRPPLPVRRLPVVLPARGRAHEGDDRAPPPRRGRHRPPRLVPAGRLRSGSQRPVQLRERAQVEEVPRCSPRHREVRIWRATSTVAVRPLAGTAGCREPSPCRSRRRARAPRHGRHGAGGCSWTGVWPSRRDGRCPCCS